MAQITKILRFITKNTSKRNIIAIPSLSDKKEKSPMKIELKEIDLRESFVKGGGKGGQAINKTNSNIDLMHIPTKIRVQCQETRCQTQNRAIARKLMLRKLDEHYNGNLAKHVVKILKKKKNNDNKHRKSQKKYQSFEKEKKE